MNRPGVFITMLVVLAAAWLVPVQAQAHAVLLGSTPAAEQQLERSPPELILNFNENVGPIHFRVLDLAGDEVGAPGEIRTEGNNVLLPLNDTLENGTYVVTWRVVSADTHPVGGSYLFSVGEPLAAGAQVAVDEANAWTAVVFVNRLVLYAVVLLGVGSVLVLRLLELPVKAAMLLRRQMHASALIALVSFVVAIGAGGAEILAAGLGALFDGASWRAGAGTTLGGSALLGVPGALLLAWASRASLPTSIFAVAAIGAALMVLSFLLTGHAATAQPVWLMATMVAVHVVCAALWFAALLPLVAVLGETAPRRSAAIMDQFSRIAVWSVAALFFSGFVISWVQVSELGLLFTTDYGFRLGIKVTLFLVLLALAARNKSRLTPRLAEGAEDARESLKKAIRIEYGLVVLILAAAVSLTLPVPPRAIAEQSAMELDTGAGYSATAEQRGYTARVEVTPARTGENMVMVYFTGPDGEAFRMVRAAIRAGLPAASIEGIYKVGHAMGGGYHFDFNEFVIPGAWELRVEGFVDDFEMLRFDVTVQIR